MPPIVLLLPALLLSGQTLPAPDAGHATPSAMPVPMEKPEPLCVRRADPPPAFAKWSQPPLEMGAREIITGVPFLLHAVDPATMKWATAAPSARPGKSAIAYFEIQRNGAYKIALGSGAWVDIVSHGKALTSTRHGHGPICTGIRKIVEFNLTRGRYALQLAGIADDGVKVMIVPAG